MNKSQSANFFKPGNTKAAQRAKQIDSITVQSLGVVKVYDKPKNKSKYFVQGDKVVKKTATGVKIIYENGNYMGTSTDTKLIGKNGVSK